MRRRQFIAGLGGAAAWPLTARAQEAGRRRRIGVLMGVSENEPEGQARIEGFRQGLRDLGWTESNLQIDYRWTGGELDRLQAYAAELIGLAPDLIVANTTPVLSALSRATRSIPIVFVIVNDPVGLGYITSLARPGGNITGFTYLEISLISKWLELIKGIAPSTERAGLMFNPELTQYYYDFLRSSQPFQKSVAIELSAAPVRSVAEIESTIAAVARNPHGSVIVAADPFIVSHLRLIASTSVQANLPTVSIYRQYALAGGLLSYGPDTADIFRRSASYVDRILKGTKPAELPAQAPTIYNFVINRQTAKIIGISIPETLLATADEVIE